MQRRGDAPTVTDLAAAQAVQRELIEALHSPAAYPHATPEIRLIETHISYVLLTGTFAYKIKKAVDLGFLDYSTLARRRFHCEEELRLNRRLSPRLYLDVVSIAGTPNAPRVGGAAAIEYAVRMIEFPQDAQFDRLLARSALTQAHLDALVDTIVRFHAAAARAGPGERWGDPACIRAPVEQNFAQLRPLLDEAPEAGLLTAIESWSEAELARLEPAFACRHRDGFVRECHGDLHLGNIALVDGEPQIFDCIEFDPNLRWIDVMNELAFLTMDLAERGRPDHAAHVLNDYLEATGDYEGLRVLPCYLVYRAMVRAKIARIRSAQSGLDAQARHTARAQCDAYLDFAAGVMAPRRPAMVITHGVTGSGKSVFSRALLETLGAVRLRSDVERRRLHGLAAGAHSGSPTAGGLYVDAATSATYAELERLAGVVLDAGFPVVVDATFLERRWREAFRVLAAAHRVPFLILACTATPASLRSRVLRRFRDGRDPSEAGIAVLERQLAGYVPLGAVESAAALSVDTDAEVPAAVALRVQARLIASARVAPARS